MSEIPDYGNSAPFSRAELLKILQQQLSDHRFQHVVRVEQMALRLADQYGEAPVLVSIAALAHDYAKERSDADFLHYIRQYHLDANLLTAGNAIWHGVVGAEMLKQELKIWDENVLNAVRHHTTGAPYMSKLEQIIFMADYIEDGRNFEGVARARELTFKNLQAGVVYQLRHTLEYLAAAGKPIYPASLEAYNAWIERKIDE